MNTRQRRRYSAPAETRPSKQDAIAEVQRAMVEESRNASNLDPLVPVGLPFVPRAESGMSVTAYYAQKHARGERGRFYPLHVTGKFICDDYFGR